MSDLDRIKAIDIEKLIERKQALNGHGGRYRNGAEHDSLVVDLHKNRYYWNSQGEDGDVIDWVGRYELGYGQAWTNSDPFFREAVEWLARYANLPAPNWSAEDVQARAQRQSEQTLLDFARDYYTQRMHPDSPAYSYAQSRGFSPDTIQQMSLGQADGKLWQAIVEADHETAQKIGLIYKAQKSGAWSDAIPAGYLVYTHQLKNRVLYFAGRKTADKWHMNQRGPKQPYWAIHKFKGDLIICEGQADALSLYQQGENALALCGVNESGLDVDLLKLFSGVYLWLDDDPAGRDTLEKIADSLGPLVRLGDVAPAHSLKTRQPLKDANDYLQHGATSLPLMKGESKTYLDQLIERLATAEGAEIPEATEALFCKLAELDKVGSLINLAMYRSRITSDKRLRMTQADFGRYLRAAKGITLDQEDSKFAKGGQYSVEDGWTVIKGENNDGSPKTTALANFSAKIVEVIRYDDGANDADVYFTIAGESANGNRFKTITIPASDFPKMNWIIENWGIEAIVSPGRSTADQLRAAIQFLSGRPFTRHCYTHTGWREVQGKMAYLTAGGALGIENDAGQKIEVDLKMGRSETNMTRYTLPQQPTDLQSAISASLKFWHVAPPEITVPIWAAMYLAPLSPFLSLDFGLWVHGKSGSMKSSITACALSHYGDWTGGQGKNFLPANFISTANATLMAAFQAKDTVLVIDDYAPGATTKEQRERDQVASRLLRSMGNRASRQRMRDGRRFQNDYPPRCLALITAEDLPPGQSIMARGIGVRVHLPPEGSSERGKIEQRLGQAQSSDSHLYSQAMAGYIRWIQRRFESLKTELPALAAKNRERFHTRGHARLPDAFAKIYTAVEVALFYAADAGVIGDTEVSELKKVAERALSASMQEHAGAVESLDSCVLFRDVLVEMIDAGQWYLLPYEADIPEPHHQVGAKLVGYEADNLLYILPAAIGWVQETYQRANGGQPFPVRRNTLYKRLEEKGWLIPGRKKTTETTYIPREGTSPRVLQIDKSAIFGE